MAGEQVVDVFISYSRRDKQVMQRIARYLQDQGMHVWVDNEKLVPGTPVWEEEIEKAIKGAAAVVVVMSPDSKRSRWVRREISYADQYDKQMFPILVAGDEESSITLRLINHQYVDFRQDEDQSLPVLSTALRAYLDAGVSRGRDESGPPDREDERREHWRNRLDRLKKRLARLNVRHPMAILGLSIVFLACCGALCLNSLLGFSNSLYGQALAPGSKILATGGFQGIKLWDIDDGRLLKSIAVDSGAGLSSSVAISPDGELIASGLSSGGDIQLLQVSDGSLRQLLEGHISSVESLAFSPDGDLLASGSMDRTIFLWQVRDGQLLHTLRGHEGTVSSLSFSPDGQMLASGSHDSTIRLWQVSDGSLLQTLSVKQSWINSVNAVTFSPDGNILASGSSDEMLRLWDVRRGSVLQSLDGHTDDIRAIAFSPDGRTVASGSDDQTVRLWEVQNGRLLHSLRERKGKVRAVGFSPDGQTLLGFTDKDIILLWWTSDGKLLASRKMQN